MRPIFDTIVAHATGMAPAAVGIVRLSGPDSWRIAGEVCPSLPDPPIPRHAHYGMFVHGDDGIVLPYEHGKSFTGEQSAELSVHGSPRSIRSLIEACEARGARLAEPGEFTERAFLHGRIDLTQAEAVRETVEAQTERQLALANAVRSGALRDKVGLMREKLLSQLVAVEAVTDFSEEVGPLDRSAVRSSIQSVQEEVDRLLETASVGRLMRHGLRVAIVGPPNVGKSSLLNALLGSDRAIVSPVPGTTRDYVEERADFGGFPVVLIDTAGLRRTEDPIEEIGVQRSISQAAHADLVWYVIDSSVGWTQSDEESVYTFSAPVEVVANKSDLGNAGRGIAVSAITRSGLPELVASAQARFETNEELPAVNLRHRELLAESATALESAVSTLASDHPDDLVSVSLQEAVRSLGEITGETATPDVVSRIFREFCIGK